MSISRGVKIDGDIRDRGKIKWTAMMLPEHVRELRKWQEDYDKVKRPVLDEFDMQTMQEEVERALTSGLETRVTTWVDGRFHEYRGIIRDVSTKYLSYEDLLGKHRLDIHEIVGVMILE